MLEYEKFINSNFLLQCKANFACTFLSFTSQNVRHFSGTKVHVQLSLAFSWVPFTGLASDQWLLVVSYIVCTFIKTFMSSHYPHFSIESTVIQPILKFFFLYFIMALCRSGQTYSWKVTLEWQQHCMLPLQVSEARQCVRGRNVPLSLFTTNRWWWSVTEGSRWSWWDIPKRKHKYSWSGKIICSSL